jgi:predicted HicB family RNase H-like nuclease
MPRRSAGASRQKDAGNSPALVRIHYEIPAELHRRAKAEAALSGSTLKEFVIRALEESIDRRSP